MLPPRKLIAAAFLLAQAGAIAWARTVETRYFAWAPFDTQNEYRITVRIAGKALTEHEVDERYRIRAIDLESRSIAHVVGIVRYAEERYYTDRAHIAIDYTVNGVTKPTWYWPADHAATVR